MVVRRIRVLSPIDHAIEIAKLSEALSISGAERNVLAASLRLMVRLVERVGGYMAPEDQHIYRAAKALLAQLGL